DPGQDHRQDSGKTKAGNPMTNHPQSSGVRVPGPDAQDTRHGPRARDKARYIMIGGFLGAGKTTSLARLAQRLTDEGRRVGLITNAQGSDPGDTALPRSRRFVDEGVPEGR